MTPSKVERITGFTILVRLVQKKLLVRLSYEGSPVRETLEELVEANLRYQAREVFKAQSWRCAKCGNVKSLQVHHKKHRSQGRDDRRENLLGLCGPCHEVVQRKPRSSSRYSTTLPGRESKPSGSPPAAPELEEGRSS